MKRDYQEIFDKTRRLVNDWDPCSLIKSGAPQDEYDTLTNKFLSGVINQIDKNILQLDIINLLNNYYRTPVFKELSKEKQNRLKKDIQELIEKI